MVDYARLDDELNALAADLDIDAVLASVPPAEELEAVDAALEALAEGVPAPKKRSFIPPKMSDVEAAALADEAAPKPAAEGLEASAPPAASGLSNFHAGLTPSDLKELAAVEATENVGEVQDSVVPAGAENTEPNDGPPTSPSIPPLEEAPQSVAPPVAEEPKATENEASVSVPPEPIFNAEDLAAIRASSPPPPGADTASADVELELEVGEVEEAEAVEASEMDALKVDAEVDELEIEELDFVEFDDDDLELEMGAPVEATPASTETDNAHVTGAGVPDLSTPPEEVTAIDSPESYEGDADGGDDGDDGDDGGEKKGFFKKIFG